MLPSPNVFNLRVFGYYQGECEIVKVDINCHIQGDVVLEGISLRDDMEREVMMFRVMFNTAFIRSNILMLNRDDIDVLWDAKDLFPKDFRAEVCLISIGATLWFSHSMGDKCIHEDCYINEGSFFGDGHCCLLGS